MAEDHSSGRYGVLTVIIFVLFVRIRQPVPVLERIPPLGQTYLRGVLGARSSLGGTTVQHSNSTCVQSPSLCKIYGHIFVIADVWL